MSEDKTSPVKEEAEMGENSPDQHGDEVGQGDEEPQSGRTASNHNSNSSDHEDHKPEIDAEPPSGERRNDETTSEAVTLETACGEDAGIKEEPMDTHEVTLYTGSRLQRAVKTDSHVPSTPTFLWAAPFIF